MKQKTSLILLKGILGLIVVIIFFGFIIGAMYSVNPDGFKYGTNIGVWLFLIWTGVLFYIDLRNNKSGWIYRHSLSLLVIPTMIVVATFSIFSDYDRYIVAVAILLPIIPAGWIHLLLYKLVMKIASK